MAADSDALYYDLFLFVAGTGFRGQVAETNLRRLCARHLAGRYTLTVVDVQQNPERAIAEGLLGLPCLVKKHPGLVRRMVGDLSDTERVLKLLDVRSPTPAVSESGC